MGSSPSAAATATASVAPVAQPDRLPTPAPDPPRDVSAGDAGPSPAERAIVAKLKTIHSSLLACHKVAKDVTGDFTISFVVGAEGKVTSISVVKRTGSAAVASCVFDRVRVLRFDVEPVALEIPFHFRTSPYDGPTLQYGSGPFDPGY